MMTTENKRLVKKTTMAIILRYNWRESLEYIRSKTGHNLSKTAFFKIKKQLKSEGRDWVLRLRDDHDEFLYEFRQRYEEMLAYQKELWDMAMANKRENPMVSVRAIDSLHSITNDIAHIIDLAPYVPGGNSSTSKQYLFPPAKKECELIV